MVIPPNNKYFNFTLDMLNSLSTLKFDTYTQQLLYPSTQLQQLLDKQKLVQFNFPDEFLKRAALAAFDLENDSSYKNALSQATKALTASRKLAPDIFELANSSLPSSLLFGLEKITTPDFLNSIATLGNRDLLVSINSTANSFRRIVDSYSGIEALSTLAKSELIGVTYQEIANSYGMKNLAELIGSLDWPEEIFINDDATVIADDVTINQFDLHRAINQFVSSYTTESSQLENIEGLLIEFLNEFKSQPSLFKQNIIPFFIGFVFLVLAAFANPIAEHVVNNFLEQPADTNNRPIKTPSALSLQKLRLVKRKTLAVRASQSMKSRSIGQLQFDQLVELIEEDGSWALVKWSNSEQQITLQGWVLSKYLQEPK